MVCCDVWKGGQGWIDPKPEANLGRSRYHVELTCLRVGNEVGEKDFNAKEKDSQRLLGKRSVYDLLKWCPCVYWTSTRPGGHSPRSKSSTCVNCLDGRLPTSSNQVWADDISVYSLQPMNRTKQTHQSSTEQQPASSVEYLRAVFTFVNDYRVTRKGFWPLFSINTMRRVPYLDAGGLSVTMVMIVCRIQIDSLNFYRGISLWVR